MKRLLVHALAAVAKISCPLAASAETVSGYARVIDGDSLEINGTEIRLHGIDAPEARQTCTRDGLVWLCGAEVSKHLRDLLQGQQVHCEGDNWDRYGRLIARCHLGGPEGPDLGARIVHSGWALAFRKYSTDYVLQEREAKNAQRGLWAFFRA